MTSVTSVVKRSYEIGPHPGIWVAPPRARQNGTARRSVCMGLNRFLTNRTAMSPRASHQSDGNSRDESNRLLAALPAESYERLLPHLEPVELAHGQVVWKPGEPIRSVYFPRTCVLSALVVLDEEAPVEAATIGREGMLGVPVVLGAPSTNLKVPAQVPGEAARIDAKRFAEALGEESAMRSLFLRYAQALQEQTSQSVACNRRHSLEERCARWLLMTHDRVGTDRFMLTHEYLAQMLGVRRAGVTVAAGMLQKAGFIKYARGVVNVLDRRGLEEASCECFAVVRTRYEALLS